MTEHRAIALPALDGRDPLGVLAALGILRILAAQAPDTRLTWDPTTCQAQLIGPDSMAEVIDQLTEAWASLPDGGLTVGLPAGLPPAKQGSSGSDPARFTVDEFRSWFDKLASDPAALEWLRALWTDLGRDKDGRCARTPFSAPTGQQTLRSMFEKPAEVLSSDPTRLLTEAVEGWRRAPGFTGENLDVRALRLASEQADGKATTYGVPGATWLALSAIPLFPMGGDGQLPRTVGWHQVPVPGRRARRMVFAWPIWRAPLDLDAVKVLLRHPVVARAARLAHRKLGDPPDAQVLRELEELRGAADALQIEIVGTAFRWSPPGAQSAGNLVAGPTWR